MSCNLQGTLVLYRHVNYPPELLQDTAVENMYLYLYLPSRQTLCQPHHNISLNVQKHTQHNFP